MTEEDMHRNETYRILEQLRGCEVEGNETGWYDGFIEDAYKDGASPPADVLKMNIITRSITHDHY